MKRTTKKRIAVVLAALAVLWGAMFVTDYTRCASLRKPVFVVAKDITADDGGSGTYQGLGYTVELEAYLDAEYGLCVQSVELWMFGRVIAASIT